MENVAGSFEFHLKVSDKEEPLMVCHRLSQFKSKTDKMSQSERRRLTLESQKKNRFDYHNHCRKLADGDIDLQHVFEEKETLAEEMEWSSSKKQVYPSTFKNQIMLSEWLIEIPEDFDTNWLIVPCPKGKRCLLVASKGTTRIFSKSGFLITKFQSLLPGGHHQSYDSSTILDCLWNDAKQCYFILDILSWSGLPLLGCEAQFRFYWIESKFNECPELKVKSAKNSFPLVSIPFSVCIKDNIESLLSLKDQSWDPLDGLLFYHKLGFYTPNVSPLVGWLKPFMLPEVIGVRVPDFYMKCQPKDYVNIKEYLKKTPKTLKEIFRS